MTEKGINKKVEEDVLKSSQQITEKKQDIKKTKQDILFYRHNHVFCDRM